MKSHHLHQQLSRALAWNTLLAPLKTIAELVSNIIILNVLPLPSVGILRLVSSAAASLGIWVDVGVDRSLPRFIPEVEQHAGRAGVRTFIRTVFLMKIGLLGLFSIVFVVFSPHFTTYLLAKVRALPASFATARGDLEQTIQRMAPWLIATVLVLVILGCFYDGLMAYLISYFRQRVWHLIGLVGSVLQPTLAATLVIAKQGISGVLIAMVLTPMVSVVLAGWQVLTSLRTSPHSVSHLQPSSISEKSARKQLWRRFFLYTGMSNILNLGDYLLSWYFAVFLLSNLAEIALYTTGTALARQILALLYTPMVGVQVPLFTRVRGGEGPLPAAYAMVGRVLAVMLIPGGVGGMVLARDMILVQYPEYEGAARVMILLLPFLCLEAFLSSAQIVLQVYERYGFLILPRLCTLFVLPLLVWVIPHAGLMGATAVIGGGRALIAVLTAIAAQRAFPLRYSWGFLGRVALASLGMAGAVWTMRRVVGLDHIGPTFGERIVAAGWLLMVAGMGAVVFVLLLRALGGLEPEDRQNLLGSRLPFWQWVVKFL